MRDRQLSRSSSSIEEKRSARPTGNLVRTDIFNESLQQLLQPEVRRTSGVLRVPRVYLLWTWRGTVQVSTLIYLAGSGGRTARRDESSPTAPQAGRARVHSGCTAGTRADDGAAGAACRRRPGRALPCAARYAALGAVSALVPGSRAASGPGAGAAGARR